MGRQGFPVFWQSTARVFHRPLLFNKLETKLVNRIKYLVGYPESSRAKLQEANNEEVLAELDEVGC